MKNSTRRLREIEPGPIFHDVEPLVVICIKIHYPTEKAASQAGPRAYKCHLCKEWHVTTKNKPRSRKSWGG